MSKAQMLADLEREMAGDNTLSLRSNLVFGEGSPDAEVMFIGEAPGEVEDRLKRPFVGRAGQLLNQVILEIGWKREDVYITNILKRRPPENRDPLPLEMEAYKPYLRRQIEILSSPVIVALGRFAMNYFLPQAKITKDQGKIFRLGGKCIVPMLHPAAALRSPEVMTAFRQTFLKLPQIAEKCKQILKEEPKSALREEVQSKLF